MVRLIKTLINWFTSLTWAGVWSVIRFGTPPTTKLLIFLIVGSIRVAIKSLVALFKEVPTAASIVANDWQKMAVDAGFPNINEVGLYKFFYVLAHVTILTGWVILFFIAVFIVNKIFNLRF